jgi:hypothetical protein
MLPDGAAQRQGMLNRVIYGRDILVHAKSLAIKALYIKWKTLSQLKRLTLTDFLESDEKASSNFLIMLPHLFDRRARDGDDRPGPFRQLPLSARSTLH